MNPDLFNTIDPNLDEEEMTIDYTERTHNVAYELEEEAMEHPAIEVPDEYTMPGAVKAATRLFLMVLVVAVVVAIITSL